MLFAEDVYRKTRVYIGRPTVKSVTPEMVAEAVAGRIQDALNLARQSGHSWLTKSLPFTIDGTLDFYPLAIDDFGGLDNVHTDPGQYPRLGRIDIPVVEANDLNLYDTGPVNNPLFGEYPTVARVSLVTDATSGAIGFKAVPGNGTGFFVLDYIPGVPLPLGLDDRPQMVSAFQPEYLPMSAGLIVLPSAKWQDIEELPDLQSRLSESRARRQEYRLTLQPLVDEQRAQMREYLIKGPVTGQTTRGRTGFGSDRHRGWNID